LGKTWSAVVVSSGGMGILPIKVIVSVTDWKDRCYRNFWHIRIDHNQTGCGALSWAFS